MSNSVLLGFGLAVIGGAWLVGSRLWLGGLVSIRQPSDWPHGIQEPDAPRFAVDHAEALRPDPAEVSPFEDLAADSALPMPEIVELHVRSYVHRR